MSELGRSIRGGESRARIRHGHLRYIVGLLALVVLLVSCDSVMQPRALGSGEIVVLTFPPQELGAGEPAVFTVRPSLPHDRYLISLTVDPAGLDAESHVTIDEGALIELTVAGEDATVAEQARPDSEDRPDGTLIDGLLTLAAGIAPTGNSSPDAGTQPVVGVARGWRLTVDVYDPFSGDLERIVDEIFAYRVQWSE